ncbi:MAG: thermonuclease family protein [Nitrosarchaeum sp.]|nr:thermonuclease family protein [Nitrosarchaeum sp.]MCV0399749.1 thermonuclease family protein [Nitrosarchaeum sp.]
MRLLVIATLVGAGVVAISVIFASMPPDIWKDHRTGFTGVAPPDEIDEKIDCLSRGGVWEHTSCTVSGDSQPKVLNCSGSAKCITEKVVRIVDGDTIHTTNYKIRLSLVDTPEIGEPGYSQASSFTFTYCPVGSTVTIDQDDLQPVDVYGRLLGKVYCENGIINEQLVQNGLAKISAQYCSQSEFSGEYWAQSGCDASTAMEPAFDRYDDCDSSYPDHCIPSSPDLDCGEIPYRNFRVTGSDPHKFDGDRDGIGCEK